MRDILLHMISPGSLSAFSASVTDGAIGSVTGAGAVQPVRSRSTISDSAAVPQKLLPQGGAQPQPAPGQTLPRGSLLDLSV
jgi:hypothetical protein